VPVTEWTCDDYNRLEAGWNTFTARLDVSGLDGVINALHLNATAKVWVSAGFDGSALQEYIDIASSLDPYDFTEESWKEVEQKLQTAIEIMEDPFTVQNSVNVASFQLHDALEALVNINQDKTALNELLESCTYEAAKYTATSFANYERNLQAAREIADSNLATQYEINEATKNLQTAVSKLVALYDKTALAAAVAEAKALDSALYTADSFAKLTSAIEQAESVLAMNNVTVSIGELAMNDLQAAKNGLKTVQTDSSNQGSTDGETPDNGGNSGGCGSVVSAASAGLALAGVAAVVCKKKKED
jgi:hypothetical protein